MNKPDHIDEQTLGAFVDGQLGDAHRSAVLAALDESPELREQVYQLRRAKDLVKLGFGGARPAAARRTTPTRRYATGIAASLAMLTIGFSAGTVGYYCARSMDTATPASASLAQPLSRHVVLHIDDSDPRHFVAALNYVDTFLKEYANGGGEIEVVANAGGLDLMRAGLSPYEQRVVDMINRHTNVHFIACASAVHNLELQGIEPRIIEDVDTEQTALEHIVERLQAGWTYVKAESLPEV